MTVKESYMKSQEEINKLQQEKASHKKTISEYEKEAKELEEKLKKLREKYNIREIQSKVNAIPAKIKELMYKHYFTFAEELIRINKYIEEKNIGYDIEEFLMDYNIELSEDFEELEDRLPECFFDSEDKSLSYEDDDDYCANSVLYFEKIFDVDELDSIINELMTSILLKGIHDVLLDIKDVVNNDIFKDVLRKYNVVKITNIEGYKVESKEDVLYFVNKKKEIALQIKESDLQDIYDNLIKEYFDYREIKESNDEYEQYLRLKEKYEKNK